MYGSRKCLKGSYFAQLYLKVYLASENECCRCCNTFPEVYNYRGTMLDCAPKMMPVPPPYCHPLLRLPTLNFGKTWSQAEKQSYSFYTAITFLSAIYVAILMNLHTHNSAKVRPVNSLQTADLTSILSPVYKVPLIWISIQISTSVNTLTQILIRVSHPTSGCGLALAKVG